MSHAELISTERPFLPSEQNGDVFVATGGLTSTVEDFAGLGEALGSDLHVIQNPYYIGEKAVTTITENEREVAGAMAELAVSRECRTLIGHSRGGFVTLLAAQIARDELGSPPERIVLIAPASRVIWRPNGERRTDDEPAVLNAVLSGLTQTMNDETYHEMFLRHADRYGTNFKSAMRDLDPAKKPIDVRTINTLINDFRGDILLIVGEKDPWRDDERLVEMHTPKPNVCTEFLRQCSHFPHVENPLEVAEAIKQWGSPVPLASPTTRSPQLLSS